MIIKEDSEWIESYEKGKSNAPIHARKKIIEVIIKAIKNGKGSIEFKYYKYELMSEEDKKKVKEALLFMMKRVKYVPLRNWKYDP